MSLRIADLDAEETVFGEGEVDIPDTKARDTRSDLGRIHQCSHLRIQNLAFEVVGVAVGGNVMLPFHR